MSLNKALKSKKTTIIGFLNLISMAVAIGAWMGKLITLMEMIVLQSFMMSGFISALAFWTMDGDKPAKEILEEEKQKWEKRILP